jgi:phosphoglycolate phosphatase-like HAD superfamily hydrolase
MEVVFHDYRGYRPRTVNGQEQPGWKRLPLIHDYLNQLGEQGWELAGVSSRDNNEMPAYFKRLK